jgi:hypothetical protein
MQRLKGIGVAPGVVVGRAVVLGERVLGEQDQGVQDVLAVDLDDLELREEQLRQVAPILPGDARDQCAFGHAVSKITIQIPVSDCGETGCV